MSEKKDKVMPEVAKKDPVQDFVEKKLNDINKMSDSRKAKILAERVLTMARKGKK